MGNVSHSSEPRRRSLTAQACSARLNIAQGKLQYCSINPIKERLHQQLASRKLNAERVARRRAPVKNVSHFHNRVCDALPRATASKSSATSKFDEGWFYVYTIDIFSIKCFVKPRIFHLATKKCRVIQLVGYM